MPVEAPQDVQAPGATWKTYKGPNLWLHVQPNSNSIGHAQENLRKAGQMITALRNLLKPDPEVDGGPLQLYVIDSIDLPGGNQDYPEGACIVAVGIANESVAFDERWSRAICRSLIVRWFGTEAGFALVFVDGTAGLAAAAAGFAPSISIAEADSWVRGELNEGRRVAIAQREHASDPAQEPAEPFVRMGYFRAATSFIAFLKSDYGSKKLHRYLSEYDSSRRDHAAVFTYHQPLAVLEEEWLTRLGHRPKVGETFRIFVKQMRPLLKPYKLKLVEILFYLIFAAGFNSVLFYYPKYVVDQIKLINDSHQSFDPIQFINQPLSLWLLLLLGLYVLNGVVSLRRAYSVNWLNQKVLNTLQVEMYTHMQKLAHNFFLKAKTGDLMSRLNDDLDIVQTALAQITNKALYQAFTVIGAVGALVALTRKSPMLAIPILCIVPIFIVNYVALRTRNKQASREQRRRVGQAMADVQQHLTAQQVVKAFRMEEQTISDYRSRIKSLRKSKLELAVLSALTDLCEDSANGLAQLVIFMVGGYLVIKGGGGTNHLTVGDLSALLVTVPKGILSPIAALAGIGQTMQQATGAMERVTAVFNEPIKIADLPDANPLPLLDKNIQLDNVTFRYGGERAALNGVTFSIPAGLHVAIVGSSGSGKSSTLNLLMRFWDPEEGRVLFDGNDLRGVTIASLRDQIGLVFQETFIFDTTLRENIRLGRPGATDDEIVLAAKAARLDDFIEALPDGYDTIPGENGSRLSGGQKQRIAVARAYLRNPRVLILDEATSALDTKTEAGVLETLKELVKGRTTISVTHRIAQAATADLIIVLDRGRVVEQGSHSTLVGAGGLYEKLYQEATIRPAAEAVASER